MARSIANRAVVRLRIAKLIAVALLGFAAILGGCGGGDAEEPTGTSEANAAQILAESAARMEQVESFHFEVSHENGSTEIVSGIGMEHAEGDVQGTERMQLEVEASFAGASVETGIVVLPEQSYLQNPLTGGWQEQEIDITDLFDPATGVTGLMRSVEEVELIDQEAVDGVDSYVLEATVPSEELTAFVGNAEAGREVTARVWVGEEDDLVRRIDLIGPLAPNDADDIVRRVTLSAFDEPVDISAPN